MSSQIGRLGYEANFGKSGPHGVIRIIPSGRACLGSDFCESDVGVILHLVLLLD
jgi:hypothetical protein